MWMRRVIFSFLFFFPPNEQRAAAAGGRRCQTLFFLFFPCSTDHDRDWPPYKVVFRVGNQCAECVFSSQSFWTSSSLDIPAGVTQEEGHTGFLIHLLSAVRAITFLARRIQPILSLVDREVEFCVLTILIVLHPLGIFFFFF